MTFKPEDFDVEPSYDADLANVGIPVPVRKNGRDYGTFHIRYVDQLTRAGELEYKRVRSAYAREIRTNALDEWDQIRVVLCHVNLVGWEGVKMKGKDVPFSVEAALAYFSREDTRWIMVQLAKVANDDSAFEKPEDLDAAAIEKN